MTFSISDFLAAFKVIKALLPPKAVEILKMISKKDIGQYITKDKSLAIWGGEDNYEFSFVPEAKQVTSKPLAANAGDDEQFADVDKKVSKGVRVGDTDTIARTPPTTEQISSGIRLWGVFLVTWLHPEGVGPSVPWSPNCFFRNLTRATLRRSLHN